MNESFFIYILAVNLITFLIMRIDKVKAMKGQYRIPERTFFLLSLLGGATGTYIGMKVFRHKTRHRSFTIGIPFLILLNIAAVIYLLQMDRL